MKQLVNYMELAVKEEFPKMLELREDICKCEECQFDMLAYALNRLPPKYVVSDRGHVHTKLDFAQVQHEADITTVLLQGMEIIGKRPRHK